MTNDGVGLPDDILVKILLLIPAIHRQSFRHVCKQWRNLIDERTPKNKHRRQILVFITQRGGSRALVFDSKDRNGLRKNEWTFPSSSEKGYVYMVGTCNGLLCLHDSRSFEGFSFSTITVTNPISGEKLELPPVPTPWKWSQLRSSGKYSLGYHPVTGKYKVVHLPCLRDQAAFKTVQVFTLGDDTTWREVRLLVLASCNLSSELLSLNGCTYWLTASSDRVMALDLNNERVMSFSVPSVTQTGPLRAKAKWKLTNAHGRLGIIVSAVHPNVATAESVEVWVMGGGGEQPRWSQTHSVTTMAEYFCMAAPQLAFGGGCILSQSRNRVPYYYGYSSRRLIWLYGHIGSNSPDDSSDYITTDETELIMSMEERKGEITTFSYIETLEPVPRRKEHVDRWIKSSTNVRG